MGFKILTLAEAAMRQMKVFDHKKGMLAEVLFESSLPFGSQLALKYLDGSIAYFRLSLLVQFEPQYLPHVPTKEECDIIARMDEYQSAIPRDTILVDEEHLPSWWVKTCEEV